MFDDIEDALRDLMAVFPAKDWLVRYQMGDEDRIDFRFLTIVHDAGWAEDVLSLDQDSGYAELLDLIAPLLRNAGRIAEVLRQYPLAVKDAKNEHVSREAIEAILEEVVFYKDRLPTELGERVQAMVRGWDGLGDGEVIPINAATRVAPAPAQ